MPQEWVVTGLEETTDDKGRPGWLIVYQVPEEVSPDREFRLAVSPLLVETRAAEYGLSTVDEVLDVLVYEPLLGMAQAAGDLPMIVPALLSPDEARAQILGQIETLRNKHGRVTVPQAQAETKARTAAADPLKPIRDSTRIDPIRMAALRVRIARYRAAEGR